MKPPEIIESNCFMKVDQATFWALVNTGKEHQVADRLYDSITKAVEKTGIYAMKLAAVFVAPQYMSTLNALIDIFNIPSD